MSSISLLQLPIDVLVNILKLLNPSDLRNVMISCKTLKEIIISENTIWRFLFREKLIIYPRLRSSKSSHSLYNLCRISQNWRHGIYRNKVVIRHNTNYMPWLLFYNSDALFLSVGSELRCYPIDRTGLLDSILWRLDVPTVTRYDVRTNDISRFVVKDNFIVCGNRDGCVAVYKQKDIRHQPKLLHHIKDCHENGQVEVTAVELINGDKQYVVTASSSSSQLCFWLLPNDTSDNRYINTRRKHYEAGSIKNMSIAENMGMRCLVMNHADDKLAIGPDGNCKPLLLDVTIGKLLLSAPSWNRKQAIRDLQWHNENTLIYVTHSGMLQSIDIRTGDMTYEAEDPFQSSLYSLKSDGENAIVVGSSEYCRCVLFDWRYCKRHVQMYFTQKKSSPIYSLDFDSTRLLTAADRSVTSLNFNVNVSAAKSKDYSHAFEVVV